MVKMDHIFKYYYNYSKTLIKFGKSNIIRHVQNVHKKIFFNYSYLDIIQVFYGL